MLPMRGQPTTQPEPQGLAARRSPRQRVVLGGNLCCLLRPRCTSGPRIWIGVTTYVHLSKRLGAADGWAPGIIDLQAPVPLAQCQVRSRCSVSYKAARKRSWFEDDSIQACRVPRTSGSCTPSASPSPRLPSSHNKFPRHTRAARMNGGNACRKRENTCRPPFRLQLSWSPYVRHVPSAGHIAPLPA